ncbi:MAG: nicotinamide riboside transporter PnuC [Bacteroidales bacterium]
MITRMKLLHQIKTIRFNPFDYFLLTLLLLLNAYSFYDKKEIDVISLTTSVSGVLCVLLAAKGNISNFIFGAINGVLYAYVAFKSAFWGEVMLNLGFYLPMQFVGYYMWSRHMSDNTGEEGIVQTNRLNTRNRVLLALFCMAAIFVYSLLLQKLKGQAPALDSASTVLSVVAMILAIKAYAEQWLIWIAVNILSVSLWVISYQKGGDHSFVMIGMWGAYLLNSVYGYRNWMQLSKSSKA